MYSIKHLFHIKASLDQVYEALTTIEGLRGWWTIYTEGESVLGKNIQFNFPPYASNTMEVTAQKPNSEVAWTCREGTADWVGTVMHFGLDRNDEMTRIRFSHINWQDNTDFYAQCSYSWGRYLHSLKCYIETSKGYPFT